MDRLINILVSYDGSEETTVKKKSAQPINPKPSENIVVEKRGRGRPPGTKNKTKNQDVVQEKVDDPPIRNTRKEKNAIPSPIAVVEETNKRKAEGATARKKQKKSDEGNSSVSGKSFSTSTNITIFTL